MRLQILKASPTMKGNFEFSDFCITSRLHDVSCTSCVLVPLFKLNLHRQSVFCIMSFLEHPFLALSIAGSLAEKWWG
jgi:hypothetical protein